jgi:hypothetical protein
LPDITISAIPDATTINGAITWNMLMRFPVPKKLGAATLIEM